MAATIVAPPFFDIPIDCLLTPQHIVDLILAIWPDGPDLDPFADPKQIVPCKIALDVRRGEDAYQTSLMPPPGGRLRIWLFGPNSGDHVQRTAQLFARTVDRARAQGLPVEILGLFPADVGSAWWKRWIWPHADDVAALGRVGFLAGRDIPFPDAHPRGGEIRYRMGHPVSVRNEHALVYVGPERTRVARACRAFGSVILVAR